MITIADIEQAHQRIAELVNRTPIMTSRTLDDSTGAKNYIKCENFQRVGAFKFRGVSNKLALLTEQERARGVVTHSSGNHAQAVALASSLLGIEAVVVMPRNAPQVKVEATAGYGARIVRCESSAEARVHTCQALIEKHGYTLVHPYDDDQIIAGAGTASFELINDIKWLDVLFCPVGGGGLLSGSSVATKGLCPAARVIAVEPERADDAFRSLRDDEIYPSVYPDTIADGLRTSLSPRTFEIIKQHVDQIITVTEAEIVEAMKFLWIRMKLVVEPSGAVSIAGLRKMAAAHTGQQVGAIISGGNVDLNPLFEHYDRLLEQ